MYYNKTMVCDWVKIAIVRKLNFSSWPKSVSYEQMIRIYADVDCLNCIKSAVIRTFFTLL